MYDSEFGDESERNNGVAPDAVLPPVEALNDRSKATSSPPLRHTGYDPFTLALRIVSILFLLCLLFVAALYYGMINP